MKLLFIHQNFPGQFMHLAPALVKRGHEVRAILHSKNKVAPKTWNGITIHPYQVSRSSSKSIHPWIVDIETKTIRAEACYLASKKLHEDGFVPDVVIAHPGWGEALFIKDVWPQTKLVLYCEYFYRAVGGDWNFDPEFKIKDPGGICRLHLKNLCNIQQFETMDHGISPTKWQASTYPARIVDKIKVIHDGIDTASIKPNQNIKLRINKELVVGWHDEVITFVNRNLEPLRGYHIFMRALPDILKRRPSAKVLIVGGDSTSYGPKPQGETTWKQVFIDEIRSQIPDEDWARVHFLGNIQRTQFTALLQVSSIHVYLSYPFVLSWSLIEAMSAGCAIVASDTAPIREVINEGQTGCLVDFFDTNALAQKVDSLMNNPELRKSLGTAARDFAIKHYDLSSACLPEQIRWVESL